MLLVPVAALVVVLAVSVRPPQAGSAAPQAPGPGCSLVSPLFDIRVDGAHNLAPDVVFNPLHEEFLVTWYTKQDAYTWDIWAARVALDGQILKTFNVATGQAEQRWLPAVAYSPVQDEYLIVYVYELSASDSDLYAKVVQWDGGAMSGEFHISTAPSRQNKPRVAYNAADDEYLVVYESIPGAGTLEIAAQRVRASDGQKQSFRVIATGAGEWRNEASVAYNEAQNRYLIVYDRQGSGVYDGRYAWTSNDMTQLDADKLACDPTDYSGFPHVTAGPDEFLYVWLKLVASNDGDIFARRFAGDGTPLGASSGFILAGEGVADYNTFPQADFAPASGYLVAWTDFGAKGGSNVHGRYVSPRQDSPAGEPFPLFEEDASQTVQGVACAPWGQCLVVVTDDWAPGGTGDYELRGKFVLPCLRVYLPLVLRKGP
jgi:hypothetical protein